mmetsp:Transcript_40789/g.74657  ORF Transcript_40789/g.74657 Transcript_40789/m.74657 type:complete len:324 (-) Transcript_40789:89-1060(-)
MMSTIHSRALARALSKPCLPRSPAASISISSHDRGRAASSRSTTPTPTPTPTLPTNRNASLFQGNRLHPLSFNIQRSSPNQRMYSSLTNGSILSSRKDETLTQKSYSYPIQKNIRTNFSYAGPKKLSDVLKTELLDEKSAAEISDLWMTYHEGKENVHGLTLDAAKGKTVLSRAAQCPFFLHPVFREQGHFMIVSQFQAPNYFLLAFLEDYQMDPARAQPLLTISLFDDYAEGKDVTLVRCDIVNRGIADDEGYNLCKRLLDDYGNEDDFRTVHLFNKKPDAFDVDEFVKDKERRWKASSSGGVDTGDGVIEAEAENKSDNAV